MVVAGEAITLGGTIIPVGYAAMEIPQSPNSTVAVIFPAEEIHKELHSWQKSIDRFQELLDEFMNDPTYQELQDIKGYVQILLKMYETTKVSDPNQPDGDDSDATVGDGDGRQVSVKRLRRLAAMADECDRIVAHNMRLIAHVKQTVKNLEIAIEIDSLRRK